MFLFTALLFVVALVNSNRIDKKDLRNRSMIVGGNDADIKDFAHQVSLRYNAEHFCGGSIYKSNIIITAAHCLYGKRCELITVGAGSSHLSSSQMLVNVKECYPHENYNSTTVDYDIAILVLEESLKFGMKIKPIPLAAKDMPVGSKVIATGFGLTTENGNVSEKLQQVELNTFSREQCQGFYPKYNITERMLCAGVESGGKDSCQTDSGGPLISLFNRELIGVISWGLGCGRPRQPGVYSSVPYLNNWIVNTSEKNGGF